MTMLQNFKLWVGKSPLYAQQSTPEVACPCTLIEQDDTCPIGQPSLLCGVCDGIGNTTSDKVQALAAEMLQGGIAAQAPAVKVLALVWGLSESGELIAESPIGDYLIGLPHRAWNLTTSVGSIFSFDTLEGAKAAAQADYEARILAAIEPVTDQPLDKPAQSCTNTPRTMELPHEEERPDRRHG